MRKVFTFHEGIRTTARAPDADHRRAHALTHIKNSHTTQSKSCGAVVGNPQDARKHFHHLVTVFSKTQIKR